MFKFLTSPWAILGILLFGTAEGRKVLKKVSKEAVRAGVIVGEKAKELAAEVKEETTDLIAEIKEEKAEKNSHDKVKS